MPNRAFTVANIARFLPVILNGIEGYFYSPDQRGLAIPGYSEQ